MSPGRFITLEGGEGTGKSTLIAAIASALRLRGLNPVLTREPGGTPLAEIIRDLALNPPNDEWSPLAHALLMNTAREDHLERQIRPALRSGRWVICDRFADSTRAYQSVQGVPMSVLKSFEDAVLKDTRADLTLILDADPEALLLRRSLREVSDTFERKDISFHKSIRDAFLDIASLDPVRCVVLNAAQTPKAVADQALKAIEDRIGLP